MTRSRSTVDHIEPLHPALQRLLQTPGRPMTSPKGRAKKIAAAGAAVLYVHRSVHGDRSGAALLALSSEVDGLTTFPLELRGPISLPNVGTKSLDV